MSDLKKAAEDLMNMAMKAMGDKPKSFLDKPNVCHCGSKHDAVEVGYKALAQSVDMDCLLWALQINAVQAVFIEGVLARMSGPTKASQMMAEMRMAMAAELLGDVSSFDKYRELQRLAMKLPPEKKEAK